MIGAKTNEVDPRALGTTQVILSNSQVAVDKLHFAQSTLSKSTDPEYETNCIGRKGIVGLTVVKL